MDIRLSGISKKLSKPSLSSPPTSTSLSSSPSRRLSSPFAARRRQKLNEKEKEKEFAQRTLASNVAPFTDEPLSFLSNASSSPTLPASMPRSYSYSSSYPKINNSHTPKDHPLLQKDAFVALEKTKERETQWLLGLVASEIDGMKEALNRCITATTAQIDAKAGDTLVISSPRSDTIKGFCTLEGNSITKADVIIKFASTYNVPVRAQVAAQCPYYLKQIATARNKSLLALEALNNWPRGNAAKCGSVIAEIIGRVHTLIHESEITLTRPPRIEQLIMNTIGFKAFQPPLPPNIIVTFSVNSAILQSTFILVGVPIQHHHHHHHHLHTPNTNALSTSPVPVRSSLLPSFKSPAASVISSNAIGNGNSGNGNAGGGISTTAVSGVMGLNKTVKVRGEILEVLEEIVVESWSPRLDILVKTLERLRKDIEKWKQCVSVMA